MEKQVYITEEEQANAKRWLKRLRSCTKWRTL